MFQVEILRAALYHLFILRAALYQGEIGEMYPLHTLANHREPDEPATALVEHGLGLSPSKAWFAHRPSLAAPGPPKKDSRSASH